ncbi:transcriptional regulator [Lewinellaceae bacterium SD302]|nr:transcriptional regulator [Lewinellaceae bacterium SD302]
MSKPTHILVIEDNEDVRANLAEILELYGYIVTEAQNGLEGVKEAIRILPDLILCDVSMPELDGYGVLNILSQQDNTAGIPFIFITARTEKEDVRRGMNLGADDYITKPFYKDELLQVIKTRLKKAASRAPQGDNEAIVQHLNDPERGLKKLNSAFGEFGRLKNYGQGQLIVDEGEFPHFIYRVKSGRVHMIRSHEYGKDYIIAELGPGEIFGLSTVLERGGYHYRAKLAGDNGGSCQLLSKEKLFQLLNEDRNVSEAIIQLMASRLVAHGDKLAHQAYDSVRRRTALILCDLHEKYQNAPIELSREELAQMVGTTKESVTRSISDFKKEGLLTTEGRAIRLIDPTALYGLLV